MISENIKKLKENLEKLPAGLLDQLKFVRHGEADDYLIIEEYPEIEYTLLIREARYEPFVAAWGFNKDTNTWGQGHYFMRMIDAAKFIREKLYGQETVSVEDMKKRDEKILECINDCAFDEPDDEYERHWNNVVGYAVKQVKAYMEEDK